MTTRRRTARSLLCLLLAGVLITSPGCLIMSPVGAFTGAGPYAMVIDDIEAIQGKKAPVWAGRPVLAGIDLPFAFVLDTAFLPIACITWFFAWLAKDDRDADGDDASNAETGVRVGE